MAATATELAESRRVTKGANASAEKRFVITDATDETEALTTLAAAAGTLYQGMSRQSYGVEPIGDPTDTLKWYGTVTYGPSSYSANRVAGESVYSFDIGSENQHITQSIATSRKYPAEAPDYQGAINVSGVGSEMTVDGVDIFTPQYQFSETHYIDYDDVDDAYKTAIYNLVGTTNDDTFRSRAAGEVLFLGASGSVRGDNVDWEITFNFAVSPNRTDITIGDYDNIVKGGWEYLWVRYEKTIIEEEGSGGENLIDLAPAPKYIYVEQVYQSGDFDGLGI